MTEQPTAPNQLYCKICLHEVKPMGEPDDTGTRFYVCEHGHQTTDPIGQQEKDRREENIRKIREEYSPENIKRKVQEAREKLERQYQAIGETPKKPNQADILLSICNEEGIEVFLDQYNESYAKIKIACDTCDIYDVSPLLSDDPKNRKQDSDIKQPQISQIPQVKQVIYKLDSSDFRQWLANRMYEVEGKAPATESLASAKNVLKGKAQKDGKQYTLYNRVAPGTENSIWIDLCNEYWQAIHVTAKGWTVENEPPILFKRHTHQLALPIPKTDGDAWQLLNFTTIDKKDDKTRLMLLCSVISYFIPLIAHPYLAVNGPHGSAKFDRKKAMLRALQTKPILQ